MSLQLSVIIVNYNGMRFLDGCFTSLYDKLSTLTYEIIVIDNNSTDESCNYIKMNHHKVHLIESKINYGFGRGNNEAVKHAKGNTILLLNNDTILLDKIDELVLMLEKDQTIGAIGIKMLDKNKNYLHSNGNFPNFFNMLRYKNLLSVNSDLLTGNFSKSKYFVDWISGAFMLIRKNTYNEIKGFDEDYFMYVEDVDFCKKIDKIGLNRIFLTNFSYIHFVGFNTNKNHLLIEGYKIYIKKHTNGIKNVILTLSILVKSVISKRN
jgi:GT2 family glycosyltransferase